MNIELSSSGNVNVAAGLENAWEKSEIDESEALVFWSDDGVVAEYAGFVLVVEARIDFLEK